MKPLRRIIYLPIETKVREFHAKLLLAAVGAEAGFDVVLGGQRSLLHGMRFFPPGIYVDKSISRTRVERFRGLRELGHEVVAWCEEGLAYRDRDTYLHQRVSVASLAQVTTFFAWGDTQAEAVLKKAPDAAGKITRSGNPRFDVLRPELRSVFAPAAMALRERWGSFILVNTNFGRFNHFNGRDYVFHTLKRRGIIVTAEHEQFLRRWSTFLGELFEHFARMLPALASAFPRHRIILRPHPSENHDVWRTRTRALPNVEVVHEGSVIPWILACDALVHNSCTTGVEAYLLDRPTITFRPLRDEVLDSELPNAVSVEATDCASLANCVEGALNGRFPGVRPGADKRAACAQRYIANLDGALAADRVVRALASLDLSGSGWRNPLGQRLVGPIESGVRAVLGRVRAAMPGSFDHRAYARQKFSDLGPDELVDTLSQLRAATGRFADVSVHRVEGRPTCYLLTRTGER